MLWLKKKCDIESCSTEFIEKELESRKDWEVCELKVTFTVRPGVTLDVSTQITKEDADDISRKELELFLAGSIRADYRFT